MKKKDDLKKKTISHLKADVRDEKKEIKEDKKLMKAVKRG